MLVCYFHSCLSHQLVHHNCAVVKYQISICNGYWYIIYHIYCSNIYSNYHILNTMVCMYIYIISYMLSCKYNLIIINYLFIHMRVTGYDTKNPRLASHAKRIFVLWPGAIFWLVTKLHIRVTRSPRK